MTEADRTFVRRVLIVFGLAAAGLVIWRLRYVLLLLFNSVLVALFLQALYQPLVRFGLPRWAALTVVAVGLVLAVGAGGAFFGWRIQQQVAEALQLLPEGLKDFERELEASPIGARIVSDVQGLQLQSAMPALKHLPGYVVIATEAVGDVLLVATGGLFIAARPDWHRFGLLKLTPVSLRPQLASFMDEVGGTLRKWLVAQLAAMITVGILMGLGLWLLGVPAPGAIGLFAAAAEFVPIVGPIVSSIPALLLASVRGLDKVLWTLLLILAIQQFESNALVPLLDRRIVRLPPLLVLFALLGFSVLFGFLGVVLAVPLAIVLKVALDRRAEGR